MRAAIRLLGQERRWLSRALDQAAAEFDAAPDLLVKSQLREQVAKLGEEFAQVVEALNLLRARETLNAEARRRG